MRSSLLNHIITPQSNLLLESKFTVKKKVFSFKLFGNLLHHGSRLPTGGASEIETEACCVVAENDGCVWKHDFITLEVINYASLMVFVAFFLRLFRQIIIFYYYFSLSFMFAEVIHLWPVWQFKPHRRVAMHISSAELVAVYVTETPSLFERGSINHAAREPRCQRPHLKTSCRNLWFVKQFPLSLFGSHRRSSRTLPPLFFFFFYLFQKNSISDTG